ncbi:Hypothetical predicted protein [Pelobates cultripes]|uniref:Kinesin-like protein KIF6/9 C-terminal domain-containing protein n=1 Tax=Pelobates cultripes TaxID=61616 RepID=A0AAD1RI98_PELCU|nr:Hypothetical predicted protein [Pelobates cultripes]
MLKKEKKRAEDAIFEINSSGNHHRFGVSDVSAGNVSQQSPGSVGVQVERDGSNLEQRFTAQHRKTARDPMSMGRQEAFEIFKRDYSDRVTIEDNKELLKLRDCKADSRYCKVTAREYKVHLRDCKADARDCKADARDCKADARDCKADSRDYKATPDSASPNPEMLATSPRIPRILKELRPSYEGSRWTRIAITVADVICVGKYSLNGPQF